MLIIFNVVNVFMFVAIACSFLFSSFMVANGLPISPVNYDDHNNNNINNNINNNDGHDNNIDNNNNNDVRQITAQDMMPTEPLYERRLNHNNNNIVHNNNNIVHHNNKINNNIIHNNHRHHRYNPNNIPDNNGGYAETLSSFERIKSALRGSIWSRNDNNANNINSHSDNADNNRDYFPFRNSAYDNDVKHRSRLGGYNISRTNRGGKLSSKSPLITMSATSQSSSKERSRNIHELLNNHDLITKLKSDAIKPSPPKKKRSDVNETQQAIELEIRKLDRNKFKAEWSDIIRSWEYLEYAIPSSNLLSNASSQLCRSNQIMPGKWISSSEKIRSFYCCDVPVKVGYSRDDSKHCGFPNVSFDYNYLSFRGVKEINSADPAACQCDNARKKKRTSLDIFEREQYEWMPDSKCLISSWDAVLFCKYLGKRTLGLVGDSTMRQNAATLTSWISSEYRRLGISFQSCSDQVHYGSSDLLYLPHQANLTDMNGAPDHERGYPFSHYLKEFDPDILILTVGPHFKNRAEYETGILGTLVPQLTALQASHWKPITILWKTLNPGHPQCYRFVQYDKLISNLKDIALGGDQDVYEWHLLPYFDKLSMEFCNRLHIPIVDMRPLYYRPDAHKTYDCLHFCVPGPMNLFPRLLLTMMKTGEI